MQFFNTLGRKVEEFIPIDEGKVKMYACGPTVYNYAHIGNLCTFVFQDFFRRYLLFKGFDVTHVMNITDVDDKTIRDSQANGADFYAFTEKYTDAFLEDLETLSVMKPDVMPKATDYVEKMAAFVKKLADKGYAYESNGSWYFKIAAAESYGELACLEKQELQHNASDRLIDADEYEKDGIHDFVLWKSWKEEDGDVFWETELGKGRPGWHLECSVMSTDILGNHFDIHLGGEDLVFPHHTNEIAQSECCTGEKYVNYWLHSRHLLVDGEKMSKSLGNFYNLRELIEKGYDPSLIRMMFIRSHYRQVLDFRFDSFEEIETMVGNVNELLLDLNEIDTEKSGMEDADLAELANTCGENFTAAMDDDLNVSQALAALFAYVTEVNKVQKQLSQEQARSVMDFIFEIDSVFAVFKSYYERYQEKVDVLLTDEVVDMIAKRRKAREEKNWEEADALRDKLAETGLVVKDVDGGVSVRLV